MSQGGYVTLVGFVAQDPNIRTTTTGKLVTKVRVGATPRFRDSATGQWRDAETSYYNVSCWSRLADHVDLWLVHWPPRGRNLVPLWRDFLAIRDEGLTRALGVSNYSVRQIDDLIAATGERPAVNQIPWSPSRYDAALLAAHADRGVAVEGYSPLKGTRLRDRTLAEIAAKYGVTPAQVVLRWHIDIGVIVIPRSARPERIEQNYDIFGFSLTPEEVARLNNL